MMEEELSQNSATSIGPQPIVIMEQELSQISAVRLSPQPIVVEVMEGESQDSAIDSPPPPYHFPVSVNQQTTLLTDAPPQYEEFSHTDSFELTQPSYAQAVQEQNRTQCTDLSQVIMKGMHA